ncbi:MAG: tripartite tricarboxylate transporter substrate binding protein [Betaproteobacteria bacterium]
MTHARALPLRNVMCVLATAAAIAAALVSLAADAAESAAYPARPIRLILAFSGGAMDALARTLSDGLERALGQPVIVEARTGASGNIAAEYVARAAPDGHTLLMAPITITVLPSTHGSLAVDPVHAFAPITKLVTLPSLIVANSTLGVSTLPELVAAARARPGMIAYATPGIGTQQHLAGSSLWLRAGVEVLHVPYSNSAQVIKDVVAGQVPVAFTLLSTAEPFVRSGQLKALAVTGTHRAPEFPEVPTVSELGFPGFDFVTWYGLVAPAGTPGAIIDTLYRESVRILAQADVRRRLQLMGGEAVGNTPDQFAAQIKADVARWPAVIKAAGIMVEQR